MSRKVIDTGIVGNDGTGDSIRDSFRKVNDNFRELYGALGLGERLAFSNLDETPDSFAGQENAVLSVNPTESGLIFKQLVGGTGIALDFDSNSSEITISNTVATISADTNPRLGGDLRAQSGSNQYRILDLAIPTNANEVATKAYADRKVALGGVSAIDPATDEPNSAFGTMTGPLVLSRDPRSDDDVTYGGLIAATKRYVDNAGFGSSVNLFVATSGDDARVGVGSDLQGRALSSAFRTIEAALKKAEEVINASEDEIGPYKKTLTWTDQSNNQINECYLARISESDDSGTGFEGRVTLTVDSIRLTTGGNYYQVGEILKIKPVGGLDANAARVEVLTIASEPGSIQGPILTFRLLTGGLFDVDLPTVGVGLGGVVVGGIDVGTQFGTGAVFNISYRVSGVVIEEAGGSARGPGFSDYGLVSVRVSGGGGTGAFGFADVSAGSIAGITITDGGQGFTGFPTLIVNLPRFHIYTAGNRTDFTGDTTTDSAEARRGRDIREGLFLSGNRSGALAQILAHGPTLGNLGLDSEGNELFDVDIKYGIFEPGESSGEAISYGDVANQTQVCVFIEAGIYLENLPLKIPQNCAIIGDEFRRSIIRPKPGPSTSPWAFKFFRRDRTIDGLQTGQSAFNVAYEEPYGFHYLTRADTPVYPLSGPGIDNRGFFRAASSLLSLNKAFIQEEVIAWINKQIAEDIAPFDNFNYDIAYGEDEYKRDAGIIIDSMAYDLLYGDANRTISTALKYRSNASELVAITAQLSQTVASIRRLETVAQSVIRNIAVVPSTYIQPFTGTVIAYSEPQIIDTAFTSETGAGGSTIQIADITRGSNTTVQTSVSHLLSTGEIITFSELLDLGDQPIDQLNGNFYYIQVITATTFNIFVDQARTVSVNSTAFPVYQPNSGDIIPNGGVVGALTDALVDIIENSGVYNSPLDNDKMDVFLCNDAIIMRAVTIQGSGGFAMVFDPEGQILAKSPYAQEAAVFSKSTGRHTFAGGMFLDGFTGNIKFKLTGIINSTRLSVGELKRFPQLPASFIVDDVPYRINYVRDFTFSPTGSTATLVLDETTPWPFSLFSYNEAICRRDVGLILDGLTYDIALNTNFQQRKSGLSYRLANASVVIESQQSLTIRAITETHDLADELVQTLSPAPLYQASRDVITSSASSIRNVLRRGVTAVPPLTITNPPSLLPRLANAKTLLLLNIEFIKDVATAYMTFTYTTLAFDISRFERDIGYIIEALAYDLVYGGNSETKSSAFRFFDGVGDAIVSQLDPSEVAGTADGISFVKNVAKDVIQNTTVSTSYVINAGDFIAGRQYQIQSVGTTDFTLIGATSNTIGVIFTATGIGTGSGTASSYFATTQIKVIASPSDSTTADEIEVLLQPIHKAIEIGGTAYADDDIVIGGSYTILTVGTTDWTLAGAASNTVGVAFVATNVGAGGTSGTVVLTNILPDLSAYAYNPQRIQVKNLLDSEKTDIQDAVIDFINANANIYEVLMPGNRSMLSNDFTQINDMGYGILVTNGALSECVSMFTYYCYTSYYSLNGGQIRSIGGSSAHGVYALAAEGSDPLEVPTPVDLYYEFSQGGTVYNDGVTYDNQFEGLLIYLSEYEYPPRENSEIEIDHGGTIGLVRYPVLAATTEDGFPEVSGKPIYRLGLSADSGGLQAAVPDGVNVTLRANTEIVLTGDVVGVATRPSTALKLNETFTTQLYRVLSFETYTSPDEELVPVSFSVGAEATITTISPHNQLPGYIVRLVLSTDPGTGLPIGSLPSGLSTFEQFYVVDTGFSSTSFKISRTKSGTPVGISDLGSGPYFFLPAALAATTLKEGYDYVETQIYNQQPFVTWGDTLFFSISNLVEGQEYTIVSTGTGSNWVSIGAGATTPGTVFTKNSTAGVGTGSAAVNVCTFTNTQTAGSFISGHRYTIIDDGAGSTDFTLIGAADNNPGTTFVASGAGTGTGTADGNIVNLTAHGFQNDDVVRLDTIGTLPAGLQSTRPYFVINRTTNSFQLGAFPGSGNPVNFTTTGTGFTAVSTVIGRAGDDYFAVVGPGENDLGRILNYKFTFIGKTYTVVRFEGVAITNQPYALIYLDRPLEDSVLKFESPIRVYLHVPTRTEGSQGTLTIRISLTRCTTHDFLEIGTGSYADTNYPNEIFGPPVRTATDTLIDISGQSEYAQVVERGEGRCFFVTTDQFGNFNVGPFFKVDQGTGTVTFSASIALSNLSGIGFKRGVPVSEFSTDNSFSDNATDTVPVENAIRGYIDRRLGVDHDGVNIEDSRLIPANTGGFLPITGQKPMRGFIDMDSFKVINVADPTSPLDAVNLRNIKIANLQDFDFSVVQAASILTFTGAGTNAIGANVVGDVVFDLDSTANTLAAQINTEVIINSDINEGAAILQRKLNMVIAAGRAAAPTGTTADIQAASGLASFDNAQFDVTSGFASIKNNGVVLGKLAQIATNTVLGRSVAGTGDVSAIAFTTIADLGGTIKKNQYTGTGFLRRTNSLSGSADVDYGVVDLADLYSHNSSFADSAANSKLVVRSSGGDFGGRDIYAARSLYIGTNAPANKLMANTSVTGTGGSINLYGFNGTLGIAISDGSGGADKATTYRNNSHRFRNYADTAFASITTAGINVGNAGSITTGSASDTGTFTGAWTVSSGTLRATSADILHTTRTINTVNFNGSANITVEPYVERDDTTASNRFLTFVDSSTAGHQRLNMDDGLYYRPDSNTLYASIFSGSLSGNASTATTAGSITSQANSATITAATAATANTIVLRDPSGDTNARYSFATYHNSSDDVSTGTISNIMAKFGDNYFRSATAAKVAAFITGQTMNIAGSATSAGTATTAATANALNTANRYEVLSLGVNTAARTDTNGSIRATGDIEAGYSDERLKTNIEIIDQALHKLIAIRGITYNPNDLAAGFGYDSNERRAGVLAQDVAKVFPEAVKPAPFDITTDEDGNEISKSGEGYKTVQYEKLIPLLIEAVKDLWGEVSELRTKVQELEKATKK